MKANGIVFSADIQAVVAASMREGKKWTRLAISDITEIRQAQETRKQMAGLTVTNHGLRQEILQRHKVEKALHTSESHYAQLLEQSQNLREQQRHLARQLLLSQEEERKRISRELHDEILQTLVGINVHLASLRAL
jgi:signal transduction histidine kinase